LHWPHPAPRWKSRELTIIPHCSRLGGKYSRPHFPSHSTPAASRYWRLYWLKKWAGHIFWQTVQIFDSVLNISILLLNFSNMRISSPNFAFLDENLSTKRSSDNFPTLHWGLIAPSPFLLLPLDTNPLPVDLQPPILRTDRRGPLMQNVRLNLLICDEAHFDLLTFNSSVPVRQLPRVRLALAGKF